MKSSKHRYRALIADNNLLFRRGLRTLLSSEGDFEVVADVASAEDVVTCANEAEPEVIIVNAALLHNDSDGLSVLRQLGMLSRVLFLTTPGDSPEFEEHPELPAGAKSRSVAKTSSAAELIAAIRETAYSVSREDDSVARTASDLKALVRLNNRYSKPTDLTAREQEVLRLLAEGRTVKETAIELNLSVKTAEAHKLNLMRKLDIHNRTALTEYAIRNGVVSSPVAGTR